MRKLDYTRLPAVDAMNLFSKFEDGVEGILTESQPLPEVYERARASLMFFRSVNDNNENWINSAYIRAGLNEFYSLEDAARRDFKALGQKNSAVEIKQSQNPLIHAMYLLRHSNVHATIASTEVNPTTVYTRSETGETAHKFGAVILDGKAQDYLQRSSEANKYYAPQDLIEMGLWIDKNQMEFGVREVFNHGLSAYCKELLGALCEFA